MADRRKELDDIKGQIAELRTKAADLQKLLVDALEGLAVDATVDANSARAAAAMFRELGELTGRGR